MIKERKKSRKITEERKDMGNARETDMKRNESQILERFTCTRLKREKERDSALTDK